MKTPGSNYKVTPMRKLWEMFQNMDEDQKEMLYNFIVLLILITIYRFLFSNLP